MEILSSGRKTNKFRISTKSFIVQHLEFKTNIEIIDASWLLQKLIYCYTIRLQVRHILANGSLLFPAFDAGSFRQDVHWAIYKCVASNSVGTIVSRDMQVKAGN